MAHHSVPVSRNDKPVLAFPLTIRTRLKWNAEANRPQGEYLDDAARG